MKKIPLYLPLLFVVFSACVPTAAVMETPQVVNIHATAAAQPWLAEAYDCAAHNAVTLRLVDVPSDAVLYIRIGEPDILMAPTYQIDMEEILIIAHHESPVQNLTLEEVRALFAGEGDPSMRIWVYSSDTDIQRAFEQAVMAGRNVASFASLAVSPEQMSDVLNAEPNTIGILPRHWMTGTAREVYSVGSVPVLTILKEEPQGVVRKLLGCLLK